MKKIFALLLLFSLISTCERDDICPESTPTTPKLIIRFYDFAEQSETKRVLNLQIQGIDSEEVYQSATSTDSVPLPLRTNSNITSFILHSNYADDGNSGNPDTITIEYNPKEIYVSRACGYKTIFENVTIPPIDGDDNWINFIQIEDPLTIDNETAAHVKIFH